MQTPTVTPSEEALDLYRELMEFADSRMHVSLRDTIAVGVDLAKRGHDPLDIPEVRELKACGWLAAHEDGGWKLIFPSTVDDFLALTSSD